MTRTEIQRRELAENERHNREMEKYKKVDSVFNAVGTVASAYGSAGTLLRGAGGFISAKKSMKPETRTQMVRGTGDTFVKSIHYHKNVKENK